MINSVFQRVESPTSYRPRQRVTQVFTPNHTSIGSSSASSSSHSDNGGDATSPIARRLAHERRTCKSFNGEIVWPPKIEAALVEALEAHLPNAMDNCSIKANLFPDRNKFCANWIKEKTGCERTARQVGSRIQMLRGKWRGTANFKLVALPRELESMEHGASPTSLSTTTPSSHATTVENDNKPSLTSTSNHHHDHSPPPFSVSEDPHPHPHHGYSTPTSATTPTDTFVPASPVLSTSAPTYPDVMCWTGVQPLRNPQPEPEHLPSPRSPREGIDLDSFAPTPYSPQVYHLLVELPIPQLDRHHQDGGSNGFCTTTTFTSAIPVYEWSLSKVYYDEQYQAYEWTRIQLMSSDGSAAEDEVRTYVSELVPKFWPHLLTAGADIRKYKVYQEIFPETSIDHQHPRDLPPPTYVMAYRFEPPRELLDESLSSPLCDYGFQAVPSHSLMPSSSPLDMDMPPLPSPHPHTWDTTTPWQPSASTIDQHDTRDNSMDADPSDIDHHHLGRVHTGRPEHLGRHPSHKQETATPVLSLRTSTPYRLPISSQSDFRLSPPSTNSNPPPFPYDWSSYRSSPTPVSCGFMLSSSSNSSYSSAYGQSFERMTSPLLQQRTM